MINFKNLILSNPLVDVETERMLQQEMAFSLGLYDETQSSQIETLRRLCEESISDKKVDVSETDRQCKLIIDYITTTTGGVN